MRNEERARLTEEAYKNWLQKIYKKANGKPLKPSSITGTTNALKNKVSELEGISIIPTNLFYHDDFTKMALINLKVRNADNYIEVNKDCGNGYLSQGLWRYLDFLEYRDHIDQKTREKILKRAQDDYKPTSQIRLNEIDDDITEQRIKENLIPKSPKGYFGKPRLVEKYTNKSDMSVHYLRRKERAENALAMAGYRCEIDSGHATFKRRNNKDIDYTESHHLIPMSRQGEFTNTLDTEENIVSLCSTCHNCIHYGSEAAPLLKLLYEKRKDLLKRAGIFVCFEQLLDMYNL